MTPAFSPSASHKHQVVHQSKHRYSFLRWLLPGSLAQAFALVLIGVCLTIGLIDYIGTRDETMLKILLPVTLTYAVGISGLAKKGS